MNGVAIITGASQGLGRGISQIFLIKGWRVVGVDLQEADLELSKHENYRHLVGDLRDENFCRDVINNTLVEYGQLNALVNNAGLGGAKPFLETTDEDYDLYYSINVRPMIRLSRFALPHLVESRGSIVNITSVFALVGVAVSAAYVLAKKAVIGITEMMATEFGRDGVRVNAIAPGIIYTPATQERVETNPWYRLHMIENSPLGRVGQPTEIGSAVEFLASSDASFITGVVLPVDGGWSMSKIPPFPRES